MFVKGEQAIDFTLLGTEGTDVEEDSLSEFVDGKPAVLVFYIYDYSPVCTTQMCEINDMEFLTFNEDVSVVGISTDGPYSHQRFIADNDISYPLLTDDDMQVYEQFGLVEEDDDGTRHTHRGIVLVDEDMTVRYRWVSDSNWDEWNPEPMHEAYDIIKTELL